tara:strand:- start:315 stop:1187 length:873 start_codon:yes stop_codon:yes gene_type:complete
MDKVVVIGGAGFVGSHTADALSEKGFQVVIYDSKESPRLRKDQDMIIGDVLDANQMRKAISGSKYVYHFAGIADIAEANKRPLDTVHLNVMGTGNAVQAALDFGVNRFIFASTMYVYSPYGSFYRATKQAAETIIETYSEQFGLEYSFLRYGSLYGPRAQEWNGLRGYVEQVVKKGSVKYRGTGEERREYIHVVDAAKLSVDILKKKYTNKAITVTGHQVLYSNELIDLIFEIAGKKKEVSYTDHHVGSDHYLNTPYRFTPKSAIKLAPEEFFDLGQGILEVIEEVSGEI